MSQVIEDGIFKQQKKKKPCMFPVEAFGECIVITHDYSTATTEGLDVPQLVAEHLNDKPQFLIAPGQDTDRINYSFVGKSPLFSEGSAHSRKNIRKQHSLCKMFTLSQSGSGLHNSICCSLILFFFLN